jgi:hypothetical protein
MKETPVKHGSASAYRNGRCRCPDCVIANSNSCRTGRDKRIATTKANGGVAPVDVHNRSTYINWSCRCWTCKDAQREWNKKYKQTKREARQREATG